MVAEATAEFHVQLGSKGAPEHYCSGAPFFFSGFFETKKAAGSLLTSEAIFNPAQGLRNPATSRSTVNGLKY